MATKYTSKLQSLKSAEQYVSGFAGADPEIQYIFIGNSIPYSDEASPPNITESVDENTNVDNSIIAAKRVLASDVNLVIPKVDWTKNTKYRQFDDKVSIDDSISGVTSQNLKPMYVITTDRNVYKCLSNNSNSGSSSSGPICISISSAISNILSISSGVSVGRNASFSSVSAIFCNTTS